MKVTIKPTLHIVAIAALTCLGCGDVPSAAEEAEFAQTEEQLAATSSTFWSPVSGATDVTIRFCFDSSVSSSRRTTIEGHAQTWEDLAPSQGVTFAFLGTCSGSVPAGTIQIEYDSSASRSRVVGVGTACSRIIFNSTSKYAVVHEFGHVLGFKHEHARSDSTATCTSDLGGTVPDLGITTYDPDSVMNYCGPNNGNLTSSDVAGFRGIYGGAAIPTTGNGVVAIRGAVPSYGYVTYGRQGVYTGLLANRASIDDQSKFIITKFTGAAGDNLENGDVVYLKHKGQNKYLTLDSLDNVVLSSSKTENARWKIRRRTVGTGRVNAGNELSFQSARGKYITIGYNSVAAPVLKATATSTGGSANWRMLYLSAGVNTF